MNTPSTCLTLLLLACPPLAAQGEGSPPASSYPKPSPEQYTPSGLPDAILEKGWSWDRIHRYGSVHKRGDFTEGEIRTLAGWDMIQLGGSDGGLAHRLKEHNPDMICLGYRNVIIWHEGFKTDLYREHPDWFLRHFRRGTHETAGTTGNKGNKPLFDMRVPEMREWWINDIARQCETEGLDGVLVDALAKVLTGWGPKRRAIGPEQEKNDAYAKLLLDEVLVPSFKANKDKGLIIANALRSGYDDCLKSYVDACFHGSYMEWIESQSADNYEEQLARLIDTCIRIGKDPGHKVLCFQFTATPPPPPKVAAGNAPHPIADSVVMPDMGEHFDVKGLSEAEIEKTMREVFPYKLAIFLICANEWSYMGYSTSHLANDPQFRWFPEYPEHKRRIGKPEGHATKTGDYLYEREFENVSVSLNVQTRQAKLEWKTETEGDTPASSQ